MCLFARAPRLGRRYVSIEAKASKLTREAEVKQGATKIPQVKPVTMVAKDPALWHLQ